MKKSKHIMKKINRKVAYFGYGSILILSVLDIFRRFFVLWMDLDMPAMFSFCFSIMTFVTIVLLGCIASNYVKLHCVDLLK